MPTARILAVQTFLLAAALVSACESSPDAADLAEWRFVEDLRIGGAADDPDGFSDLKGLLVTRSGNIWALEASTQNIRVFDSTGRLLRKIGREGQGPGEFTWPDGMASAPDGLVWVHDPQNGRFSIFHGSGDFVRQQVAPAQMYGWVWNGGIDRAGRIWDQIHDPRDPDTQKARRVAPDWSRADTLTLPQCQQPGWNPEEGYFVWRGDRGGRSRTVPFYPLPVQAYEWSAGAVWCAPTGAEYRLIKLDVERKDTIARITRRAEQVPVTTNERDSVIAGIRKSLEGLSEPDWSRIPRVKPVIERAFVDDADRLWVLRGSSGSGSLFDLYSSDGQPIASFHIPHALIWWVRPVVRGEVVWLAASDQDGIPYIVRGRIGP